MFGFDVAMLVITIQRPAKVDAAIVFGHKSQSRQAALLRISAVSSELWSRVSLLLIAYCLSCLFAVFVRTREEAIYLCRGFVWSKSDESANRIRL